MAGRKAGSTKIAVALVAAVVGTAFGTPAIGALTPAPDESASPTSAGFSPAVAAAKATEQYRQSSDPSQPTIPLVTVEATPDGPKVVSHEVSSAAQARAVATDAARGHDLVAVDTDDAISPVGTSTYDPGFSYQWALNPSKTSFLSAWNTTQGGGITVAVVDTGVAAGHPDLAGKVLPGHEFLGQIDQDLSPMIDDCGHGTHVAGTIAAVPNNGIGIAGAAPHVRILPVRVLSAANQCGGWSSDVARGIVWAANQGARVINLSLGGPGPDAALARAVRYARSKGAVVVAAAGNNHGTCTPYKNRTIYPGASAGAIGVGAVDSNLQHACFSNTGRYVDLAAPGVHILSTVVVPSDPAHYYSYASWDGTSMATPHVSAAAALVLAYRPICTPGQVEQRLESTARRLPLSTFGTPRLYGAGLVDPAKALAAIKALKPGTC